MSEMRLLDLHELFSRLEEISQSLASIAESLSTMSSIKEEGRGADGVR